MKIGPGTNRSRWLCLVAATAIMEMFYPSSAQAHLVTSGLGPFYDGLYHLFLSPDDLLGVLGLALLAGLGGTRFGRLVLFTLPGAWILGGIGGLEQSGEVSAPVVSALSLIMIGGLVAADRKLKPALVWGLAVGFGLFHGYLNGSAAAQANLGFVGLLGISVSVFVLVALLAALTVSLRPAWARVAVRVAGSWITAIGLLMTGWALR